MKIENLQLFCDVVDLRSFSRAASENGMSQSSTSQVIHQLEQHLGVVLLDRARRPFVLTAEGLRFYDGCRQLIKQTSQLETEVRELHDETSRKLTVASIYSVGLAHMSAFMRHFSDTFPKAQVRLEYLHPDRVCEVVEKGDVDLGLISYAQCTRTLKSIPWRAEPFVLVCPPLHRLAQTESIELKELAGESFIAFEAGLRIRLEIDRALRAKRVQVDIAHEFDNIEFIKRSVEVGDGLSLLPEPTVEREVAFGTLCKVRLRDEQLTRPLGIIHRRDAKLSTIAHEFVTLLQAKADFADKQCLPGLPIDKPPETIPHLPIAIVPR